MLSAVAANRSKNRLALSGSTARLSKWPRGAESASAGIPLPGTAGFLEGAPGGLGCWRQLEVIAKELEDLRLVFGRRAEEHRDSLWDTATDGDAGDVGQPLGTTRGEVEFETVGEDVVELAVELG